MAVLITGANRGLGFSLAKQLLLQGRDVVLAARNLEGGRNAAQLLTSSTGRSPLDVLQLDTGSQESVERLVQRLSDGYEHPLDCLVNNAGIYLEGWTQAAWDETRSVNVVGPVTLAVRIAPLLCEGGRVVMVSSGYGKLEFLSTHYRDLVTGANSVEDVLDIGFLADDSKMQGQYVPTYKVSKAMLNQACQLLSKNHAFTSRSIGVSCCCPGWCSTDMGGPTATSTPEQGAESIAWLVQHSPPMPNGGFFRNGKPMEW